MTQVSGAELAGVPCQLRCKEECRLSVGSSLTPRSFSSRPQLLAIRILSGRMGNKKSQIGHAFAKLGMPSGLRVYGCGMRTVHIQHILPPTWQNETVIIGCLTKGCKCDWSGFRQQFRFRFTPNDFWVSVPFWVHPLTPTSPCQESLLVFSWLLPLYVTVDEVQ